MAEFPGTRPPAPAAPLRSPEACAKPAPLARAERRLRACASSIAEVAERLTKVFSPAYSADQIGVAVDTQYHRFDGSKVRTYVPLLVEHGVRDQLRAWRE